MKVLAQRWHSVYPRWGLILALILALIVRLLGILSRPIWYDEAFAVLFAEKGLSAMLIGTLAPAGAGASDVHPLGYYTVLWAWMRLFGESLLSVRALSVAASLATIVVVHALARELFDVPTALVAAFLASLAPFQVHYGQEIRMYSFLGLWLLLATFCYWRGTKSSLWLWWAGLAIFAAFAQYTHNLAGFYLLALAFWPVLTRNWRALGRVFLAGVAALVLYLPWLTHLPAQFAKVDQTYWIQRPGLYRLLTLLLTYITNLPLGPVQLAVGLFAALTITILALMQTLRAARIHGSGWQPAAWILYLALAPPLLVFLFSQWKPVYLERAFLPSGTAFCVWLAWAMMRPGLPRTARLMMIMVLGTGYSLGLYQHLVYRGVPYAPYRLMAESLHANLRPGDVIVHSSKLSFLPTVYFDRALPARYIADPPGSGVDTLAVSTQQVLGLEASPNLPLAVGDAGRVWFIIFDESIQEYVRAGYPMHPHLNWLMMHYVLVEQQAWDGLDVYLFSTAS